MDFHTGDQVQARGHTWTIRRIVLATPSGPRLVVKRPGWRYHEVLHPQEEEVTLVSGDTQ